MRAFLSPGLTSSNHKWPTKLHPTRDFSAFHLFWCWCCGLLPSAPLRGHVPTAVRRFVRFPDASRYSHSYSKHRYSHSRSTHRHSHSHCCTRDRPHGLLESATGYKVTDLTGKTDKRITLSSKIKRIYCHPRW